MSTAPHRASRVAALLVLLGALWPLGALAQPQGDSGFKVGEGRLHPSLDLESRFDSALGLFPPQGQFPTDPGTGSPNIQPNPSGDFVLHVRPGVRFEQSSARMQLLASGHVDWVRPMGWITPTSTAALERLEGLLNANLTLNPQAPVGLEVGEQLVRSDRGNNLALGNGVLSLFNELRLGVPLRPGGGALELRPEVAWALELFSPLGAQLPPGCPQGDPACDPRLLSQSDYHNLRAGLQGHWRFLPKTAVVVDARFDYRVFPQAPSTPSPTILRASAGLAGLLTPKLGLVIQPGWSWDFSGAGASTFTGQFEATYQFSQTLNVRGGYHRSLEPVSLLSRVNVDRFLAEGRVLLAGRLTARGLAQVDLLNFASAANAQPRSDSLVRLDLGADYLLHKWVQAGAGYLLTWRGSNSAGIPFTRHELYLRASVLY